MNTELDGNRIHSVLAKIHQFRSEAFRALAAKVNGMNEKLTIDQAIQILHECNEHRRLVGKEDYIAMSPDMVDHWEELAKEAAFYLRCAMTNSELATR